jgi:hypothetical protein
MSQVNRSVSRTSSGRHNAEEQPGLPLRRQSSPNRTSYDRRSLSAIMIVGALVLVEETGHH